MSNKLSHSSVSKFTECAKAFEYHYVHRYRSNTMSAALLFGTAVDKAVEILVTSRDFEAAVKKFDELWKAQEINGVITELKSNPNIVYANNDLDLELLDDGFYSAGVDLVGITKLKDKKDEVGFDQLTIEEKSIYNAINWVAARKRGHLMLETVRDEILPNLTKVYSTQEKIDLTNGEDSVIGFVDLVADYKGYDTPIILDFKTSTKAYEEDSVKTSPQLALYVHALTDKYKTRKAGFIVLSKVIQKNRTKICSKCGNDGSGGRHKTCNAAIQRDLGVKRCEGEWKETINPKAKVDVIIDDIPEQLENIVVENFDNVNKMINNNIFIRNLNNCIKPYGKCDFYSLCHRNSTEGLIKKDK